MTNCGGDAGVESCCTSLEVPGGTFDRTYYPDLDGGVALDASDPATVSGFRLDKYEVTVGRFRQFVAAALPSDGGTAWVPSAGSGKHVHLNDGNGLVNMAADGGTSYEEGWNPSDVIELRPTDNNLILGCDESRDASWTITPSTNENRPIACTNWWEEFAFCVWDGGFLPTDAEWACAGGGGSEEREYPWGTTNPGTTNEYEIFNCYYPPGSECGNPGDPSTTAPVGLELPGAARWGQLDLAGNVMERVLDFMAPYTSCTDCALLSATAADSVARGGNFNNPQRFIGRDDFSRSLRGGGLGFRCARTP